MCCRLRLDLRELRRKSGAFFGSREGTGSVSVVAINTACRRLHISQKKRKNFTTKTCPGCRIAQDLLAVPGRKITDVQRNKNLQKRKAEIMFDIGIVGGGTAGMTAAIYGQRAGKKTVIIEGGNFGGQITSSPNVENYPGIASVSGSEFSMNLLDQAMKLGTETVVEKVTGIRDEGGIKVIETTGKEYPCRSVILATGVTHRHLGVPGEEKLTGAGVSYCATCDGAFFRGRDVAVIGGGSTALQDAEFLSNYCKKVYLVHRRDEFRGEESIVRRLREKENVEFVLSATVNEILGDTVVEGVSLNNKKTGENFRLDVAGVFIAVGQIPQNEQFAETVKLDGAGFILASEDCMTSHPGIFAAGDCRTKEVRQLTTAAADGAVAALAACRYVAEH